MLVSVVSTIFFGTFLYSSFYFAFISTFLIFFFQAEDGIRDGHVTGVQTCALPISIGELINIMQRGNASIDRVNEILDYEADVQNKRTAVKQLAPDIITFTNVSFSYPSSEVMQLTDISLQINSGETIGIVGKTGAGKSTLIKLLLRDRKS